MTGRMPHLVQYQGSKRLLAPQILRCMPHRFERLVEPFSGTAAISVAVAREGRANKFHINDLNAPLIGLLQNAVENPQDLVNAYAALWNEQFSYEDGHVRHFYEVRDRFNRGEETPANMLYLLARCVKGAVRYGKNGNFNQSPDKRRHGTSPQTLSINVEALSVLLKERTVFSAVDYREILGKVEPGDLVYMDPPYQGVSHARDNRYYSGVPFDEFVDAVRSLNRKGVAYLISYDGECGQKEYGRELPDSLRCHKILLNAGLSSQSVLLGKRSTTFEALYISEALMPVFLARAEPLTLFEAIV